MHVACTCLTGHAHGEQSRRTCAWEAGGRNQAPMRDSQPNICTAPGMPTMLHAELTAALTDRQTGGTEHPCLPFSFCLPGRRRRPGYFCLYEADSSQNSRNWQLGFHPVRRHACHLSHTLRRRLRYCNSTPHTPLLQESNIWGSHHYHEACSFPTQRGIKALSLLSRLLHMALGWTGLDRIKSLSKLLFSSSQRKAFCLP